MIKHFFKHYFSNVRLPLYESKWGTAYRIKQLREDLLSKDDAYACQKLSLSTELLRFTNSSADRWFLEDAVRGTLILGVTGSGKTSGSGRALRESFLISKMGGLVLCVKTDEANSWIQDLKRLGRSDDLVHINPSQPNTFNFIDWFQKRQNKEIGFADQLTNSFLEVLSVLDRSQAQASDPFWERTIRQLLTHAIIIASHLSETLSISELLEVIKEAPTKAHEDPNAHAKFLALCARAKEKCSKESLSELDASILYFMRDYASLADKTRSIIDISITSMLDPFLRKPLNQLFCGLTSCRPDDAFQGKVIVVDVPVHSYHFIGLVTNLIWKTAFKNACQSRINPTKPVFIWMDECQYLIDKSDSNYQSTARSTLSCSVFLSPTLSNLYSEVGKKEQVDSLLAALHTKILHQNDDVTTNKWASEMIGKLLTKTVTKSIQTVQVRTPQHTHSETTRWETDVPSRVFLNLAQGGNSHPEAIVLCAGKKFSSGKPWVLARFEQN